MQNPLDIAAQFAQIGTVLKEYFEQAERAKAEMNTLVATVKTAAERKINELDGAIKSQVEASLGKNRGDIETLTDAVNRLSRGVLARLNLLEREIGVGSAEEAVRAQGAAQPATKISAIEAAGVANKSEIDSLRASLKTLENAIATANAAISSLRRYVEGEIGVVKSRLASEDARRKEASGLLKSLSDTTGRA